MVVVKQKCAMQPGCHENMHLIQQNFFLVYRATFTALFSLITVTLFGPDKSSRF